MAFFEADADSTALKATQDGLGNTIASTYVKGLSASGTTITIEKGDGTTSTINTQDTTYGAGTASTLGLTKLYTGTGSNTNGAMTQAAVTSALSDKADSDHNHDSTYLKLTGGTVSGNITATGFTGNLSGTATKLATARTIQTNLASTSYASFDGSNNITPGVTGILPMTNGGLGTSDAAVARKNLVVAPVYMDDEPTANTYDGLIWIGDGIAGDSITYDRAIVDDALSLTSENPVQNKVVTGQFNTLNNSIAKRLDAQSLTASGGTLTFSDSSITTTSLIDVYATIPNIAPSDISASTGTCVVTFDAQESAFDVCITVRN